MDRDVDPLQEENYDKVIKIKDKSIKIKVNILIVRELVPLCGIGGQKRSTSNKIKIW